MLRSLIAAAALLLPASALADATLFLRFGSAWVTDPAFDLVAEADATPQLLLGAGWEASDALTLELAYGLVASSATAFEEALESSLAVHQFQGAAVFRMPISDYFAGRLRGAAAFEMATLHIDGAAATLEDFATGLGLEGTLGLELRLPVSPSIDPWASRLAFLVEAGWSWHPLGFDFGDATVDRDEDLDPAPLAAGAIDLGSIDLSGPLLRFGVALSF